MKKKFFKLLAFFLLPVFKLYWFVFRPKSIGVKCILRHQNKVLLIRNAYGLKLWTLPGGGVKYSESLEDATIREVKEEVGITIQNPRKCGSLFYDGEYKRNTIWVFLAEISDPEFKTDDWEIEEAKWFETNKLPKRKSSLLVQFLALAEK